MASLAARSAEDVREHASPIAAYAASWRTSILALAVMLAMFGLRIWDLGIVQNDDAIWALQAWRGDWDVIWRWARDQGRIWALVTGPILLFALKIKGSLGGDLAILATFAAFFVAFHLALAMYFGRALAVVVAALNLAFWSLRWEGSVLTAYPAFTWLFGLAFIGSLFAARRYLANGRPVALAGSVLLLLLALFMHEGVSVLFATLYVVAVVADARRFGEAARRARRALLVGYAIATVAYFIAYFAFRYAYPSAYAGNSLAPFAPLRIARVAASFALSGSLPFDAVVPYAVRFSNPASGEASRVVYDLGRYVRSAATMPEALAFGVLAAFVCWQALRAASRELASYRTAYAAIAVGVLITFVPILPVAMTVRYQQWHFDHGIRSYVHTAVSHFGVALTLGAALLLATRAMAGQGLRRVLGIAIAVLVGALAAGGHAMNDAIAADMRGEANRWRAMDRAIELLRTDGGASHTVVVAPRFASGSWFTALPPVYWTQWAKARHGVDLAFTTGPLPVIESGRRTYLIDFRQTTRRAPTVIAARLRSDKSTGATLVDRILVAAEPGHPEALQQFVAYSDQRRGHVVARIDSLPALPGTQRIGVIDNISAEPASIQIQRDAPLPALPIACPSVLGVGQRASFGTAPPATHCMLGAVLRDGWHAPERNGVWSKAQVATLRVRIAPPAGEDANVRMTLKSYAGHGFYPAQPTIRIRAGGSVAAEFVEARETASSVAFVVPRAAIDVDGTVDLAIEIDRVFNPKALGIATDTRDLGVHLQSIELVGTAAAAAPAGNPQSKGESTPR